MNAHIRRFTPSDRASLEKAINIVCAEGRWMSTSHFQPTPGWRHALEEPTCSRHCLLVVEDQDRIVGWCRVFPETCEGAVKEAELGVGLVTSYRNHGLGAALVRHALNWAGEADLHHVWLNTREDNARARRVFARCAFRPAGISGDWIKMVYQIEDVEAQGESICD
jgi:RimJ/RimL family protein N-acetyltransferase